MVTWKSWYELSPRPARASRLGRIRRRAAGRVCGRSPSQQADGRGIRPSPFVNRTSAAWSNSLARHRRQAGRSYGRLRPGEERSAYLRWTRVAGDGLRPLPLGVKVAEDSDATVDIRDAPASNRTNPESPEIHFRWRRGRSSPAVGQPDRAASSHDLRRGSLPRIALSIAGKAFLKDSQRLRPRSMQGRGSALSHDGTAEDDYGPRFYWSPDSQKLLAIRTKHCERNRKVDHHRVVAPATRSSPSFISNTYVCRATRCRWTGPQPLRISRTKSQCRWITSCTKNPGASATTAGWRHAVIPAKPIVVTSSSIESRGHQVLRLLAVDAATGAVRAIIDEHSPTFIDYSGKFFLNYVDASNELIRCPSRDGWNHLLPLRRQYGKSEEPDHQGSVGCPRRRPRRRVQAANLVPRRRHPSRARPLLHPLLPRQLRRHGPDGTHRGRWHAQDRLLARRQDIYRIRIPRVDMPPAD